MFWFVEFCLSLFLNFVPPISFIDIHDFHKTGRAVFEAKSIFETLALFQSQMIALELFVRHARKPIQSQPVAPILPVRFCNMYQVLLEYLIPLNLLLWAGVEQFEV
jgi:hypothetical protein